MTSKLTREKAQWLHDACEEAAVAGIKLTMNPNELLMFTSYVLAAMDSEPASIVGDDGGDALAYRRLIQSFAPGTKLYRHAQQPVVTFYRDGIEAAAKWIDQQREAYDSEHGWSDPDTGAFEFGNDAQREYSSTLEELAEGIRALHPNAGNYPVIGIDMASGTDRSVEVRYVAPPGYVMVPKEPTERMVIDGVESEPDELVSEPEVWEAYQEMSGCEQAAHRARLCWAAMLAAAPQEVKGE